MHDAPDTTKVHEIRQDDIVMFYSVLGCVAITALSGWLMLAPEEGYRAQRLVAVGVISAIGFGGFAVMGIMRLLGRKRPIITISPDGIRDIRVSHDTVPWSGVAALGEWRMQGHRAVELTLEPEADLATKRLPFEAMLRGVSRLGPHGVAFSAGGLLITYDDLRALIEAYYRKYGPGGPIAPTSPRP